MKTLHYLIVAIACLTARGADYSENVKSIEALYVGRLVLSTNSISGVSFAATPGGLSLSGNLTFAPANTYNIGAAGGVATPKDIYLSGDLYGSGANGIAINNSAFFYWLSRTVLQSPADGVLMPTFSSGSGVNRVNFGGATAAFPAIGRTNGDLIVFGANGAFDSSSTNRLHVPGGIVTGVTNVFTFSATNPPPASAVAPTKWISVRVAGDSALYRLPLYE